jgi:hypothetical protein
MEIFGYNINESMQSLYSLFSHANFTLSKLSTLNVFKQFLQYLKTYTKLFKTSTLKFSYVFGHQLIL